MEISVLSNDIEELKCRNLFEDSGRTIAGELIFSKTYPWEVLPEIGDFIIRTGMMLSEDEYDRIAESVWISKTAEVAPTALINGPAIICEGAVIRHCAFIRGNAIVGRNAVVGNSVELKNVILFDGVQTPHYNYVGDSVLGYKSHMGAGAITSNVKSDKTPVSVNIFGKKISVGLKKMGAILGDNVEVGCNSVLNPGVIVGKNTNIYPLSCVRGYIRENSIYKNENEIAEKY